MPRCRARSRRASDLARVPMLRLLFHRGGGPRCNPQAGRAGSSAFTLIELLVVTAVMAILAVILMPSLNRAKTAADSTVCGGDLRQYAAALCCYVGDFKYYALCCLDETHSGATINWCERLEPYTKTRWAGFDTFCSYLRGRPRDAEAHRGLPQCPEGWWPFSHPSQPPTAAVKGVSTLHGRAGRKAPGLIGRHRSSGAAVPRKRESMT
jgi:prepilin-type N-terminal cleavage/methylation domain-containing protein